MLLGACGSSSASKNQTSKDGSSAPAGDGVINIGYVAERGGTYAALGEVGYNTAQLAVKNLNDAGGITLNGKKYTFALKICDDNSQTSLAAACTTKLISDDGVKFIFGGISSIGPVINGLTEPNKVINFSASSTVASNIKNLKYTIVTLPSLHDRVAIALAALKHQFPNVQRVGFIADNVSTSDVVYSTLQQLVQNSSIKLVGKQTVPTTTVDYASAVSALKTSDPQVVFAYATNNTRLQELIKSISQLSVGHGMLGFATTCNSVGSPGLTTGPFVGYPGTGTDLENPSTPETKEFVSQYQALTGSNKIGPNLYTAEWNYDFYGILAKAIQKAGTFTDTDAVMSALEGLKYTGLEGTTTVVAQQAVQQGTNCVINKDGSTTDFVITPDQIK